MVKFMSQIYFSDIINRCLDCQTSFEFVLAIDL